MIQLFHHANDKYGQSSGMSMYKDPLQYVMQMWAILQIPVYLLMWLFYILHRWVLHSKLFYKLCHSGHHAFRPPTGKFLKFYSPKPKKDNLSNTSLMHGLLRSTGWSGIAVGPSDIVFEGILPYTVPLFFLFLSMKSHRKCGEMQS